MNNIQKDLITVLIYHSQKTFTFYLYFTSKINLIHILNMGHDFDIYLHEIFQDFYTRIIVRSLFPFIILCLREPRIPYVRRKLYILECILKHLLK